MGIEADFQAALFARLDGASLGVTGVYDIAPQDDDSGDDGSDGDDEDHPLAIREDLKRKRAKYKGQQVESDNADFTLHLVFDNRDQLLRFIEEFEIDPTKRFIDGVDFAATVLDLDLRAGG